MAKFAILAASIALLATFTFAEKVGKATVSGKFTGTSEDLQACYKIVMDEGYGDNTCWSTVEGSVWSPTNPADFGTSVSATMAFTGTFCNVDSLKSKASSTLGNACPNVGLTITGSSSSNTDTDSSAAFGSSAAAVVAGVAAAAVAVVAF